MKGGGEERNKRIRKKKVDRAQVDKGASERSRGQEEQTHKPRSSVHLSLHRNIFKTTDASKYENIGRGALSRRFYMHPRERWSAQHIFYTTPKGEGRENPTTRWLWGPLHKHQLHRGLLCIGCVSFGRGSKGSYSAPTTWKTLFF